MATLNASLDADWTVNQVVASYPATLPVLGTHGIDTCCGGLKSLREVATAHGIQLERLLDELDEVINPREVVLDVRPDLRAGQDPLGKILAASESLKEGESLVLLVGFEPLPLYKVLEGRGFNHRSERTADGAWKVTFRHNKT